MHRRLLFLRMERRPFSVSADAGHCKEGDVEGEDSLIVE
jgi:hypothetical protein